MKINMKRLLSMLMALCMVIGMVPSLALNTSATVVIDPISYVDIDLEAPEAGKNPSFVAGTGSDEYFVPNVNDGNYTAGVAWHDGTDYMTEEDTFEAGKTYTAYVIVEADASNGAFLTDLEAYVAGEEAEFESTDSADRIIVYASFELEAEEEVETADVTIKVVDENGNALGGASVFEVFASTTGTTDEDGFLKLDNLVPGSYIYQTSLKGYKTDVDGAAFRVAADGTLTPGDGVDCEDGVITVTLEKIPTVSFTLVKEAKVAKGSAMPVDTTFDFEITKPVAAEGEESKTREAEITVKASDYVNGVATVSKTITLEFDYEAEYDEWTRSGDNIEIKEVNLPENWTCETDPQKVARAELNGSTVTFTNTYNKPAVKVKVVDENDNPLEGAAVEVIYYAADDTTVNRNGITVDGIVDLGVMPEGDGTAYANLEGYYSNQTSFGIRNGRLLAGDNLDEEGNVVITLTKIPAVEIKIPFTKVVELGGNTAPKATDFEFEVTAANGVEPLVTGATISTNGAGTYTGEISVVVAEEDMGALYQGYLILTEKAVADSKWECDDTIWMIKAEPKIQPMSLDNDLADRVKTEFDGTLKFYEVVEVNGDTSVGYEPVGDAAEAIVFTNTYTENVVAPTPTPDYEEEDYSIFVRVKFDGVDEDEIDNVKAILVRNGKEYKTKLVNEKINWEHEWKPLDERKDWSVDAEEIEGYDMEIKNVRANYWVITISKPVVEKANPDTGASDFVGAAVALAACSAVCGAALMLKRK